MLTAWNGLAIAAYADGFRALKDPKYRETAEKTADFLLKTHRDADGRLLRSSQMGKAKGAAYLEDYAFLGHGLLRLHAATNDPKWLAQAKAMIDRMIADFSDKDEGGFFFTADNHETLIARIKDPFDGALPGANSVAILDLMALSKATGDRKYEGVAGKALEAFSPALADLSAGVPLMLVGLEEYLDARGKADAAAPASDRLPGGLKVLKAEASVGAGAKVAPGAEFGVKITLEISRRLAHRGEPKRVGDHQSHGGFPGRRLAPVAGESRLSRRPDDGLARGRGRHERVPGPGHAHGHHESRREGVGADRSRALDPPSSLQRSRVPGTGRVEGADQGGEVMPATGPMGICGLLNLNKPIGVTSRDVVDRVSRPLRKVKVGHAGTLDPLASGVLVVCVGPATRLIEYVQAMPKTYRASIRLGATSDTLDADGHVVDTIDPRRPSEAEIREAIVPQVGTIHQVPPQFSALKVNGRARTTLPVRARKSRWRRVR